MDPGRLSEPIVQAPLAGGPSTPKLAAAVGEAGGFGFLAAGYKTADAVREDIALEDGFAAWTAPPRAPGRRCRLMQRGARASLDERLVDLQQRSALRGRQPVVRADCLDHRRSAVGLARDAGLLAQRVRRRLK